VIFTITCKDTLCFFGAEPGHFKRSTGLCFFLLALVPPLPRGLFEALQATSRNLPFLFTIDWSIYIRGPFEICGQAGMVHIDNPAGNSRIMGMRKGGWLMGKHYQTAIIGAGTAGLTAALYAARSV
jgi:hypothetical protein